MALYIETISGTFVPWGGEPIAGIRHPIVIGRHWPDADLEAIGLYRPAPASAVPDGKAAIGQSVQRVNGVVRWVYDLADAPEPEPPTPEQVIEAFRMAIQSHVDAAATAKLYDSGNSLATYKDSTVPQWAAEAAAFIAWRDAVWAYSYAELDKVLAAEREQPSIEAFIAELPEIVWPEP